MGVSTITAEAYGATEEDTTGRPNVRFYRGKVFMDPIERDRAIEEGRMESTDLDFVETDFIRITFPGNRFMVYDQPIRAKSRGTSPEDQAHPQLYPREWAAYQDRTSGPVGFPLTAIPELTGADIAHLEKFDILSVENLAGLPDVVTLTIGQGVGRYRDIARAWMRANVKPAINEAAQSEIDQLKAQVAQLMEMVTATPKRARPARIEDTTDAITE